MTEYRVREFGHSLAKLTPSEWLMANRLTNNPSLRDMWDNNNSNNNYNDYNNNNSRSIFGIMTKDAKP